MAIKLPPPPVQESELNQNWKNWFLKVKDILTGISSLSWTLIDFTNSSITDILERKHNDLQDKQGGTTDEYYHLSLANFTDLTDSGNTTLHYHSDDRNRANHTGTQLLSTISDAGTAASQSGLSTTVTLAALTGGGITGSLTFTNGVLTSKVDPT